MVTYLTVRLGVFARGQNISRKGAKTIKEKKYVSEFMNHYPEQTCAPPLQSHQYALTVNLWNGMLWKT
jgi:hypothetical protein